MVFFGQFYFGQFYYGQFYFGPKPQGLHTTVRELQMCTFQGPGASNTTKIPRKDPQERENKERKL